MACRTPSRFLSLLALRFSSLDPVIEAGAAEFRRLFGFEIPAAGKDVAQGDDLAGVEQAHAVAQVQLGREVFADGEGRGAQRGAVGDAGLDAELDRKSTRLNSSH